MAFSRFSDLPSELRIMIVDNLGYTDDETPLCGYTDEDIANFTCDDNGHFGHESQHVYDDICRQFQEKDKRFLNAFAGSWFQSRTCKYTYILLPKAVTNATQITPLSRPSKATAASSTRT